MDWTIEPARPQGSLPSHPYDRWVSPQGIAMAEFHRHEDGYLIRFLHQADFLLKERDGEFEISARPTPDCDNQAIVNLYHNAIQPILGNHAGGLFLHGSAVVSGEQTALSTRPGGIAFLGLSRGGKTTLAGSFARAGHPFLTEDVIDLRLKSGEYWLQPKRSKLRLFADSARHLIGDNAVFEDEDMKQDVDAGDVLPFFTTEAPLRQIYLLGTDHTAPLSIRQLTMQEALSALMPHAFILDVEDKERLKAHFSKMADLSQDIPCYALDFTRDYAELPRVRAAVLANLAAAKR